MNAASFPDSNFIKPFSRTPRQQAMNCPRSVGGVLWACFATMLILSPAGAQDSVKADPSIAAEGESEGSDVAESAESKSVFGEVSIGVAPGGIRRYRSNRWGMVAASIFNRSNEEASGLIVVTPQGSGGVQFARRVAVPAQMQFSTAWPVRIGENGAQGLTEMDYLFFPSGEDDGEIRRRFGESEIPSISGMISKGPVGISGVIPMPDSGQRRTSLQNLMRAMRFAKLNDILVATIFPQDVGMYEESLNAVDHLAVGDPNLLLYPETCESIRSWVCRGGRLLIAMDQCGPGVAQCLLGDSLNLDVVGETSVLKVQLDLNSDYSLSQFPVRTVTREFDEPIRYLRVHLDGGEPIWHVDGWPVAVRVPMGLGTVMLTSIESDVFYEPRAMTMGRGEASHGMIASSRRMLESMYNPRVPGLLSQESASSHAAEMVGYQVPGRHLAAGLLIIFPIALIISGLLLHRREQGQKLVYGLPVIAVLASVPAILMGAKQRAVAPTTVIETSAIASSPGATQLPGEGFASVYLPDSELLSVRSSDGTVLNLQSDATNQDFKRLVWEDPLTSHWVNLQQHVGLKTHEIQFKQQVPSAIEATATFTDQGLEGTLKADGLKLTSPVLLATENHMNMSCDVNSNRFKATSDDLLAEGQYFKTAMVTDENRFLSALMNDVFNSRESQDQFPAEPLAMFWVDSERTGFQIGDEAVRRRDTALVTHPIRLTPPNAGDLVVIPPPFLPYRSIETDAGSYSSVFSNQTRRWTDTESPAMTRLQFDIPDVCHPFEVASAELTLSIRAASRTVSFRWGSPGSGFTEFSKVDSPLGLLVLPVPKELLSADRSGKLFVEFSVGEAGSVSTEVDDVDMSISGEQDDSWKVDRLWLTVTGKRVPPQITAP
ncbi:MAG: hypothetical protein ACK58L_10095 [Planctomycetota bacterium]